MFKHSVNLSPRALFGLTLALAVSAAVTDVQAATPTQRAEQHIDNRQDRQETRIESGVASGALTAHETRRLGREQAGIVRAEARAEADGKVTKREAAAIQRRQNAASRDIYRQKHDAQVRPQ